MTLHLKSRGYPFRPRLLFSSFIVVGVGFPTVYYFRRGQNFKIATWALKNSSEESNDTSEESNDKSEEISNASLENEKYPAKKSQILRWILGIVA